MGCVKRGPRLVRVCTSFFYAAKTDKIELSGPRIVATALAPLCMCASRRLVPAENMQEAEEHISLSDITHHAVRHIYGDLSATLDRCAAEVSNPSLLECLQSNESRLHVAFRFTN